MRCFTVFAATWEIFRSVMSAIGLCTSFKMKEWCIYSFSSWLLVFCEITESPDSVHQSHTTLHVFMCNLLCLVSQCIPWCLQGSKISKQKISIIVHMIICLLNLVSTNDSNDWPQKTLWGKVCAKIEKLKLFKKFNMTYKFITSASVTSDDFWKCLTTTSWVIRQN